MIRFDLLLTPQIIESEGEERREGERERETARGDKMRGES